MRRNLIAALAVAALGVVLVAVATAAKNPGAGSTGVGSVFASNPVQELGREGLTDQKDADTAVPAAAYHDVMLTNLDGSGYLSRRVRERAHDDGKPRLLGDEHVPLHASSGRVRAGDGVLLDHRGAEVRPQARLRRAGRLPAIDNVSQPVRINQWGVDNSFTTDHPTNEIRYGKGGVDDAEDAEVILHEYGHALHQGQDFRSLRSRPARSARASPTTGRSR